MRVLFNGAWYTIQVVWEKDFQTMLAKGLMIESQQLVNCS